MKYVYAMLLACTWTIAGFGQSGKLLLVGGGREDYGSWSDPPYRWAVEQAPTPNVAIIGYEGDGSWYSDYFEHLGANKAQAFLLDSEEKANNEQFLEELASFDVFFFRGGDQFQYYRFLKNSRLRDFLSAKYQEGAVLAGTSAGMAILSGVIFTAANGSVYPEQALKSLDQPEITLANDLFSFYPEYIFDTHFIERGRFPRLLAFMAAWEQQNKQPLAGIGVDDKTALCIDAEGVGTVYGTAGVHFYTQGTFNKQASGWTGKAESSQLLHGMKYSLTENKVISGPQETLSPLAARNSHHPILLSGHDTPQSNQSLTRKLKELFPSTASLLILSPTDSSQAYSVKQHLQQQGFPQVAILQTSAANNQAGVTKAKMLLSAAELIVLAQPSITQLRNFMDGGPAGALLEEIFTFGNQTIICWGKSSALAGSTIASNLYEDPLLAYEGKLRFSKGLGLIEGTVVIPGAFHTGNASYFENIAAALPLAMVRDSLRFGLLLQEETVVSFTPGSEKGNASFGSEGHSSNMLMENPATKAALPGEGKNKRSSVAFQGFRQYILDEGYSLTTSGWKEAPVKNPPTGLPNKTIPGLRIYPNPANQQLWVECKGTGSLNIEIRDSLGRTQLRQLLQPASLHPGISLNKLAQGWYIVCIRAPNNRGIHYQKLVIRR